MKRLAAVGLTAGLLLLAGSAGAQESCEGRGCPATTTSTSTPPDGGPLAGRDAAPGPARDEVVPDIAVGDHRSSSYELNYDEGAWDAWGRKVVGARMADFYTASRAVTITGIWAMHKVLTFGYEDLLQPVVTAVAGQMGDLADAWGLWYWGPFTTGVFALGLVLRGRAGRAAGEIATTLTLVTLTGLILGNLSSYYQSTVSFTRNMALMAIVATDPNPQTSPEQALTSFDRALHKAFVEDPYIALNWGGPQAVDACQPAVAQILQEGPHQTDDRPRVLMSTYGTPVDPDRVDTRSDDARKADQVKSALGWLAGGPTGVAAAAASFVDRDGNTVPLDQVQGPCVGAARYNAKPTGDRMMGAFVLMLASFGTILLLLRIALRHGWQIFLASFGWMVLPLLLAGATFPGAARDAAFHGIERIARQLAQVIACFVILGVVIGANRAVLGMDVGVGTGSMLIRFLLVFAVMAAANLYLGRARRAVAAAVTSQFARYAQASRESSAPVKWAAAGAGAAGVLSVAAAKHRAAAQQIQSAKTIGSTAAKGGRAVGRGASAAMGAPAALVRAPVAAGRAVASTPARIGRAAGRAQARATQAAMPAGRAHQVMMTSPQLARRAPALQQVAHRAAAATAGGSARVVAGRPTKPTARVVAAGGGLPGQGKGRQAVYVESAADRRTLPHGGSTTFPTREARKEWADRTEYRVARLVGQTRRPFTSQDLDPRIPPDRAQYVIGRSHAYSRILEQQQQSPPPGRRVG